MFTALIDDRWEVVRAGTKVRTDRYGKGSRYRARYRIEAGGSQFSKSFSTKREARAWLAQKAAEVQGGTWIPPEAEKLTVGLWCDKWLEGYASRKASTYRQAETHVKIIKATFEDVALRNVRPSDVNAWVAKLQREGRAASYVYAVYRRFAQIMGDAVHDGLIAKSPCSRRTAPSQGQQRPYVATTEQVWEMYDAFPDHLAPAVLLAAFAGLRLAECAALRVADVDFKNRIITPVQQYPAEALKTDYSRTPVPIPLELAHMLKSAAELGAGEYIVVDAFGRQATPWAIQRAARDARQKVKGLPEEFRFHDLRHYYASVLIAAGLDVKIVQTRMRHKNATTTLNVYGHLFPDKDETAREAIASAMTSRAV